VLGPDRLTPEMMAATMSDVLGSQINYEQDSLEQLTASMIQRGASPATAHDFAAMYRPQEDGIYDEDWSQASPTSTTFRTWCETVLAPAAR
jgi:hypothetical protein